MRNRTCRPSAASGNPPENLRPRPNRILAEPATPATCASDRRAPAAQANAEGAARGRLFHLGAAR